ncbi:MAG: sensor histidine kinase [Clostridia bacterium]|nr:sensor histidine kinase [Clostridia bacterium]
MDCVRDLDEYLQNVSMFTEYVVDIELVRLDSSVPYSMNNSLRRDYDYMDESWFQTAVEQTGLVKYAAPHGTDHLYNNKLENTFTALYPVYRKNFLHGYVVMECNLGKIAEFIQEDDSKDAGFILLDEEGDVIYDHQKGERNENISLKEELDEMDAGKNATFQRDGKLYSVCRLAPNNWLLILESDEDVILLPIRRVLVVVMVVGILSFIILIGIAVYNAKRMEKPYNALIERISSYDGSGSEKVFEDEETPQEVALIRDKFEEMADKLNSMINEVYVAELKQKEMELEALTNQINPHFLYNVFQVIQTKAVLADNQEIEDMIQAFSMMMRYTMERKHDKVQIGKEIEYIQNYLMFYKVRLARVFDYEIEYDPELANCYTLKFILQPVVENCFKHAFKDRKSGGRIQISIYEQGKDIYFKIWDNGCGIDPDRLKQVQEKLQKGLDDEGIGIVNTNLRLQLIYGYQYGLSISSVENEYTEVEIKIKKEV